MKKLALILALLMLLSIPCSAFAEAPDVSAMTSEELQGLIDAARNELLSRELADGENIVLVDQDGVQVYLTGDYEIEAYSSTYLYMTAVVINNTDHMVGFYAKIATINGWDVDFTGTVDVSPGSKKKAKLEWRISDADISTFEEIEEMKLSLQVYDSSTYDEICDTEPTIYYFG